MGQPFVQPLDHQWSHCARCNTSILHDAPHACDEGCLEAAWPWVGAIGVLWLLGGLGWGWL